VFLITRLVIFTPNVQFAMQTTQALEKFGAYQVMTFTSEDNTLAYLRDHAQDVLIVDLNMMGSLNAARFVKQVRDLQPHIAFIALPNTDGVRRLAAELNLHGLADYTFNLRKLLPVIQTARETAYKAQPDTAKMALPLTEEGDTQRFTSDEDAAATPKPALEVVLADEAGETKLQLPPEQRLLQEVDVALEIFQKLAAEEPPLPKFDDQSTVRDLMVGMADATNISRMIATFPTSEEDTAASQPIVEEENPETDVGTIPAAVILATTHDDSTPQDGFSLHKFLENLNAKMLAEGGTTVQPLPSWVQEAERYIREPDFLNEDLPQISYPSQPLEYTSAVTNPSDPSLIEGNIGDIETERSQLQVRSHPETEPPRLPTDTPLISAEDTAPPAPTAPLNAITDAALLELPPLADEPAVSNSTPIVAAHSPKRYTYVAPDEAYIAQVAVVLTQVALELTAQSLLLARDNEIVAYDSLLPPEDLHDIERIIGHDWNAEVSEGRIRFFTLSSSGQDYMLYSRGVTTDFTLSLVFAGTLPLHIIRRQGKRMADALAAVPPIEPTPPTIEPAEEPEVGTLIPYTLLWLLRDAQTTLTSPQMQALVKGLDTQLTQLGWTIQELEVHEDFVYLYAQIPDLKTPLERVRDLVRRCNTILTRHNPRLETANLWSDSYLILTPGRKLSVEERQDFIHFAR
jgi:DNA-binding NarL/FixJ family response regulator/REP element-mobilizing transposase RayT